MLSNAGDLARAGLTILDREYLNHATFERFAQPGRLASGAVLQVGRDLQGVGWRIGRTASGAMQLHHSGSVNGGRSHLAVIPEEGIAIAILCNTNVIADMDQTAQSLLAAWHAANMTDSWEVRTNGIFENSRGN